MWRDIRRGPLELMAVAACCGLVGAPTLGQAVDESPADIFAESVRVQVVNLEVVVTNEEDERVTGLGREAFRLLVDGEEVPILYFSEIGSPAAIDSTGDDEPAEESVSFLVFVDDHVSLSRNRDFTLERLRGELGQLRPNDRMAIVAYDGRKITVLSAWSKDLEALETAIVAAIERPSIGIRWVALARSPSFLANWIGNATRRSILAAGSSMRLLPRPSGRKVMLLVAGSWDPREARAAENFSPWCLSGPCAGNSVFLSLTDTANELGYSIYAVDVEGRDVQQSWSREQRLQKTLAMLARQTGGKTLLNGQRKRMLSIASSDSRVYYSIGFEPGAHEASSRHQIEIEMVDRALEARGRESFVAVSERRRRDVEAFSAVLADAEASQPSFPVEVGPSERLRGRRMRVPVSVFAPTGELAWLTAGRVFKARFEVSLATLDVHGHSTVESHQIMLEEPAAAVRGEAEHLEFELNLKRRAHNLAVVIRDLQSDGRFITVVPVEPTESVAERVDSESSDERVPEDSSGN